MTFDEIKQKYNVDVVDFKKYLSDNGKYCNVKTTLRGEDYFGNDLEECINGYREYEKAHAEELKIVRMSAEDRIRYEVETIDEEKEKQLASILITSGFNFDGYKVVKYSGYISGDAVTQVDRGTAFSLNVFGINLGTYGGTNTGTALENALVTIRRKALLELKEKAYNLGCNAIIGVDFDYITLDPETASTGGGTVYMPYVFCVTANGNAVIIEKE